MPRGQFDGLRLELADGERVHVYGRAGAVRAARRLPPARAHDRALRARRPPRGARAAEAQARRRGPVRGRAQAAAAAHPAADRARHRQRRRREARRADAITARFPPANVVVAETFVQGPRRRAAIATAIADLCERGADVIVLARGGGSFEDLLPFSDERLVRAVAACPVPVVTAVGHEQDTPLCDLAADVRASTPVAAARLVVPDLAELRGRLDARTRGLHTRRPAHRRAPRRAARRDARAAAPRAAARARAPARAARDHATAASARSRPLATLERGYAIVRPGDELVRAPAGRSRRPRSRSGRRRHVRSARRMSRADVRGDPGRARADRRAARARRRRARGADAALGARRGALPPCAAQLDAGRGRSRSSHADKLSG